MNGVHFFIDIPQYIYKNKKCIDMCNNDRLVQYPFVVKHLHSFWSYVDSAKQRWSAST